MTKINKYNKKKSVATSLLSPAIFLDRDGTINYDKNYLCCEKDLKIYKNIEKSLIKARNAGFKIVIVTNQSGVARKYFTLTQLKRVNATLVKMLKNLGVKIDGMYYCPHGPDDNCDCRKPKPGMAYQAAKDLNIDLKKSYMIGDSVRDYIFGYNFGGKGIMVLTGHGKKQFAKIKEQKQKPLAVTRNLSQAIEFVLKNRGLED